MNIILLDQSEIRNNRAVLRDRRSEHIRKVLGSMVGDTLRTGIINGPTGTSTIVAVNNETVELATDHSGPQPERPLTDLILALPRPIMLKRVLSQAATLGVGRILLINANRVEKSFFSASLLQGENILQHLLFGLEQAGDTLVPEISVHNRFRPFVEDLLPTLTSDCPVKLIAHPGPFPFLPQVVELPLRRKTVLAIGPEGGWIDFEVEKLQQAGFKPFSLGPRILRVDSAVPVLLSQIDLLRRL
ncbi:MAG: 16S rRNA (uracil(1498)-N(3))-methyltransferase [Desulfobulbaceae bacterium DB1]|nr:MAG: 16S rRNA (uracil(1498)-N(3))-methyltransferase [Desulfobulbaceae bacterium DB1]